MSHQKEDYSSFSSNWMFWVCSGESSSRREKETGPTEADGGDNEGAAEQDAGT